MRKRSTGRCSPGVVALTAVLLLWGGSVHSAKAQSGEPSYAPVIRAIVRDIALPELPRVSPRDSLYRIFLSDVTLFRCPEEVTGPCVMPDVHLAAQREGQKARSRSS